jgi:diguanylate cyclase (GGDEF)-like protein
MRDPNDNRNTGPRVGSPLWIHLTSVIIAGAVVFALAMTRLSGLTGWVDSAGHHSGLVSMPVFWVLAAMAILGQAWPVITPGRSGAESPVASVAFCFAALLHWGLAVAVLLRAGSTLVVFVVQRKALHRALFNAAQATLSVTAAAAVLMAFGIMPSPQHPWVPLGADLWKVALAGFAYFIVNFVVVGVAIALHNRVLVVRSLRAALPYQGLVSTVLLATAPLVTVVMAKNSALLLLLFVFPLAAIYINAAISVQREHQAHHDELTGLSNRKLLLRRTTEALAQADMNGGNVGFLLLDLDRGLKEVNDTLGHAVGDRLLQNVAQRLTHSVRPGDLVARLGGDEFAVLLPSVKEPGAAREVAARLRAAVAEPIRLEQLSFVIEVSIGIAIFPDDATSADMLMQRADVAMYLAKQHRTGVERYQADLDRNSPAKLALLAELRRGLDRRELELHYQPKVYLCDQQTAGMEALVRWRHPEHGMQTPEQFLPVLEQSYLMRELTSFVVDTALAQAAKWHADGMPVQISLNVSGRDLLGDALVQTIAAGLKAHRVPSEALLLEIDERVLTSEPAHSAATAEALTAIGVRLSLDDFGTGYSSLARLQRLPISEVKIDSSFVGRVLTSPDDEVIVKSIVDLAAALGIRSVAEGVESAEVAAALLAMGCVSAQGWFFSRPLNAASATAWLREHRVAERAAAHRTGYGRPAALPGGAGPTAGAAAPAGQAPAVNPPAGWMS